MNNSSWHGQINRTLWELSELVKKNPKNRRYRREFLRAHFLQGFEFDKAHHIPRDDRTFLFLHDDETPACLLLHGSNGTPAEMRDLGNHLYSQGISVYCPRLARVDTKEDMESWESWVTHAEACLEAVMTYSRNTFIAGLSLGGTVALNLSRVKGVRGIALLAPALFPKRTFQMRLREITRFLTPTIFYRVAGWKGEALKAMDFARKHAKKVDLPVLVVQAADDDTVSSRGPKFVKRHAERDCEVKILAHGSHALTRGPAREEVFELVTRFVTDNVRAPRSSGNRGDRDQRIQSG